MKRVILCLLLLSPIAVKAEYFIQVNGFHVSCEFSGIWNAPKFEKYDWRIHLLYWTEEELQEDMKNLINAGADVRLVCHWLQDEYFIHPGGYPGEISVDPGNITRMSYSIWDFDHELIMKQFK